MLFYNVEGTPVNCNVEENKRVLRRTINRKILCSTERFNEKHGRDSFYFVSDFCEEFVKVGVITDNASGLEKTLNSFLKHISCELNDIKITETTINGIQELLNTANHMGYIANFVEVMGRFGISKVLGRRANDLGYGENLIDENTKVYIFARAEKYLVKETLVPELERVYTNTTAKKTYGHPVHYVFQVDDRDIRRESYKTLLQALYANKRLGGRRYSFVDFDSGENYPMAVFDALYNVCVGGAVVIRYYTDDGNRITGSDYDLVEKICDVVKSYRNQVLTIICLPTKCEKLKALFYEHLGTMAFVEIQEDAVNGDKARDFLRLLAKENHVRADKALLTSVEEDVKYSVPELREIFDGWYNEKLKRTIYPQYKDVRSVNHEAVKAAPKGSAYDALQEMVGLKEAKAVIQKALNYYKMRKLCEQKGIKSDTPAMHMVFTGNPGTAKTTVARLFARIMKDNGLLSKGQLVEVGRGDLVAKFVGWTAQTVQAKFKEAVGGVLFIDEAYSLVDDRSGSFGDEAINTIVQEMENHREDVVVIFAGYPDKMEEFMQKNPGLRSRVAFHVPFADYDAHELCEIATLIGKSKGVSLEDEAVEKLSTIFETACRQSDFGNGRYVRNVLEQAKMNQASRLLEYDFDDITTEEITTIRAVDIIVPNIKTEEKRRIGFAS